MNMNENKLTVDAGACRFLTKISTVCQDDMTVRFTIESDCPSVRKLADALGGADAVETVSSRIFDNPIMAKCNEFIPHPACPVPCALVKACEVAADLAVKKNVSFVFG